MPIIEKKYVIDGEEVELVFEGKIKCFTNKQSDIAYVTDIKGEVIFYITAQCGQNMGYLEIEKYPNE